MHTALNSQVGGDYNLLELSSNKYAKVDNHIFDYLNQFKWSVTNIKGNYYALRQQADKTFIYLHQEILGKINDMVIDHIDGDGLNNMLNNLRHVTKSQNHFNNFNPSGISKYKGVWKRKDRKKEWVAEITVKLKKYYLGSFYTEQEAALAYNDAAINLVGLYAKLNEVNNEY